MFAENYPYSAAALELRALRLQIGRQFGRGHRHGCRVRRRWLAAHTNSRNTSSIIWV